MRAWLLVAALNGALAVLAGAFAAHGLAAQLDPRMLAIFETGARYHMYHALALGIAALAMRERAVRRARVTCALFLAGIAFFSGSLYLYALTSLHPLVFFTPVGGILFVAGWLALGWTALAL